MENGQDLVPKEYNFETSMNVKQELETVSKPITNNDSKHKTFVSNGKIEEESKNKFKRTGRQRYFRDKKPLRSSYKFIKDEQEGINNKTKAQVIPLIISSINYPSVHLTQDNLQSAQDRIVAAIDELSIDGIAPSFAGYKKKNGWLKLDCLDEYTADFVRKIVPTIKLEGDILLKVSNGENFPQMEKYFVRLLECNDLADDKIIHRIKVQNHFMRDSEWWINSKKVNGDYIELTLSVDAKTASALKDSGSKIKWKFGSAHIKKKDKKFIKNVEKQPQNRQPM